MSDKDDSPTPRVRKIWNQESNVSPYPNTNGGNYGSMSVDLTKISILEPDYAYYSFHRNVIPDYFINSLKAREVTVPEVNQQFQPTSDDIHVISTNSFAKGYVGCIFQLETAIFRLEKVYLITFLEFLNQLSKDNPNYLPVIEDYLSKRFDREQIEDWVGLPFREVLLETYLSFINPYDEYQLDLYEKKFFLLFEKIVEDNLPLIMPMIPQFVSFAQELIADQITITIMTNLPRYIAMKLLIMSGLSRFLEGKLPIEHLITPTRDVFTIDFRKHPAIKSITTSSSLLSRHQNHQLRDLKDKSMFNYLYNPQYGPHYQSKQYAYACAIMRKHTGLTLVFDRNYQHITLCKKLGMACIGLKGAEGSDKQVSGRSESNSALFSWKLRGSDLQINDYSEITIDKIYQLMKRYVKWINGPTLQRQEAPVASVKSPPSSRQRSLLPYRNEVSPAMLTELERLENRKKQKLQRRLAGEDDEIEIGTSFLSQDESQGRLRRTTHEFSLNDEEKKEEERIVQNEKNLSSVSYLKPFQFSLQNLFGKSNASSILSHRSTVNEQEEFEEEEDWSKLLDDNTTLLSFTKL